MIPPPLFEQSLRTLLAPIETHLDDPSVSEIMINGPDRVFIERRGQIFRTESRFDSAETVMAALRNVAQYAGGFVDQDRPILEARLPDGSRIEAVIAPIAENGPNVAIRRFSKATLTLAQLVELGALSGDAAEALVAMALAKCNVMVAGGTGSGKTTLLNALAGQVPGRERMLVLEDTREINVSHEHVLYLTARRPDEHGAGEITIRDLFRASLRMRPDRLIVGEVRGAEAMDLVQATVSGHGGCLSTLHASFPHDAMTRLETMCMMSDLDMPLSAIRNQLSSGIDLIVQVSRLPGGGRGVTHVTEVLGLDADRTHYALRDLFVRTARSAGGAHTGAQLVPTGALPTFMPQLATYGVTLPGAMLRAAEAQER